MCESQLAPWVHQGMSEAWHWEGAGSQCLWCPLYCLLTHKHSLQRCQSQDPLPASLRQSSCDPLALHLKPCALVMAASPTSGLFIPKEFSPVLPKWPTNFYSLSFLIAHVVWVLDCRGIGLHAFESLRWDLPLGRHSGEKDELGGSECTDHWEWHQPLWGPPQAFVRGKSLA